MSEDEILAEFRAADALLEGHFILSSGLHSPRYLQCARVLADPMLAARLAPALPAPLPRDIRGAIEMVFPPALGGLLPVAYIGRQIHHQAQLSQLQDGPFLLRSSSPPLPVSKEVVPSERGARR